MHSGELDSLQTAITQASNGARSNTDARACCADANEAITYLRARVEELDRDRAVFKRDYHDACKCIADMHRAAVGQVTGPRRGVIEDVEDIHHMAECAAIMAVCGYFSRMREPAFWYVPAESEDDEDALVLPARNGTCPSSYETKRAFPLYAGSAPVPAEQMDNPNVMTRATVYARDIVTWLHRDHYADSTQFEPFDDLLGLLSQIDNMICGWKEQPAVQEVDVDAICNAYESGVGHRGRPTANVNPYREGTPEHEAYAIGAKGEAAQATAIPKEVTKIKPYHIGALQRAANNFRAHAKKISDADPMDYAVEFPATDAESIDELIAMLAAKAEGELDEPARNR